METKQLSKEQNEALFQFGKETAEKVIPFLTDKEFTAEQIYEMTICQNFGGNVEVIADPSLSPELMNYAWNIEKEKGLGQAVELIDFVKTHNVDEDSSLFLYEVNKCLNSGIPLTSFEKEENLTANRINYLRLNACADKGEYQKNFVMRRIKLTGIEAHDDVVALMSEGREDVKKILDQIYDYARTYKNELARETNGFYPGYVIMLDADDMNIRGQQIVDALEYCGGDVQKLTRKLDKRDGELTAYVNQCAAQRWQNSNGMKTEPFAVTNGASFVNNSEIRKQRGLTMNPDNFQKCRTQMEAEPINYSGMEIHMGIDPETAVKVAEAHGFRLGLKWEPDSLKDVCGNQMTQYLFINDKGDILSAVADKQHFCYGGCQITGARNLDSRQGFIWSETQANWNKKGTLQFLCTYKGNGLFQKYDNVPDSEPVPQNLKSVEGMEGIPVPKTFNYYNIEQTIKKTRPELCYDLSSFYVVQIANLLKLNETIPHMSDGLKAVYQPIQDNLTEFIIDTNYNFKSQPESAMELFEIAAGYAGLSEKETELFEQDILKELDKEDERETEAELEEDEIDL